MLRWFVNGFSSSTCHGGSAVETRQTSTPSNSNVHHQREIPFSLTSSGSLLTLMTPSTRLRKTSPSKMQFRRMNTLWFLSGGGGGGGGWTGWMSVGGKLGRGVDL